MLKREQLSVVLDLKNRNAKSLKLEIACVPIWKKIKGHSKINDQIKRNMYVWITRHPQAVQSPIYNKCLKVIFNYQKEPQLDLKMLLQVSICRNK